MLDISPRWSLTHFVAADIRAGVRNRNYLLIGAVELMSVKFDPPQLHQRLAVHFKKARQPVLYRRLAWWLAESRDRAQPPEIQFEGWEGVADLRT